MQLDIPIDSYRSDLKSLNTKHNSTLKYYQLHSEIPPHEAYLQKTAARMLQLKKYHAIRQEYTLPIPYLCQVYHLLNLEHLETVHHHSLKGLKVGNVSQLEETQVGETLKFETSLDSSPNILRMWRKPSVEVELTLLTPYTIELTIPVYHGRKITILFNILPLADNIHKLFIDIYSSLIFPKPILQMILHCAAYLTLFEDLPYLHQLATENIYSKVKSTPVSNRDTMQLFKRYVDLYGSSLQQPQVMGAIELRPLAS